MGVLKPARLLAVASAAVAAAALVVVAGAAGDAQQTGTLVVRLATEPSPPGVTWTYSGAGPAFVLGGNATEHTAQLPAGTYQLREAPTQPGQPRTLTALTCTDSDGNTHADVATASATVGLEDGETVTCTFAHRALGRRSGAAALALARMYAPVLRFAKGEPYKPLRMTDYLSVTSLRGGSPPRGTLLQPHPTLFSLPTGTERSYLDVGGAEPNSSPSRYAQREKTLEARHPRPLVYWEVVRQKATSRVAIEYWLLYLYNDFYDRHEADWEGVTVFLQGSQPIGISYSAHQGRRFASWAKQTASATHPVVYVARGSHANYPKRGRYSIRVCWTLRGRHCTPTPKVDTATGDGATLRPSAYDLDELGGPAYSGSWGSGNYVLGIGRTSDQIGDPRRRADYSSPFRILG